MDLFSVAVTLFLIMDPFGNIPIFLSVLEAVPPERRRRVLVRELVLALIIIIVFIFGGKYVMGILGLRQESVSIGGAIILFLIALHMVFPTKETKTQPDPDSEPLLVPLAVPLIAGPSVLAFLLLFASAPGGAHVLLLAAAGLAWVGTFLVLFFSTYLARFLGRRGLIAIERLMGMVLVALAVQLFLDGLSKFAG